MSGPEEFTEYANHRKLDFEASAINNKALHSELCSPVTRCVAVAGGSVLRRNDRWQRVYSVRKSA